MAVVAVVGSMTGVRTVISLGALYPTLQFVPLAYKQPREVPELVRNCRADVFLFCGPVPYQLGKPFVDGETPSITLAFDGGGLVKALLALVRSLGTSVRSISVDVLKSEQVAQVMKECHLDWQTYTISYLPGTEPTDFVRFHTHLYQSGKIDGVLTCLRSVWQELTDRGIPAINIEPMFTSIREALDVAVLHDENRVATLAQIAVLLVHVPLPASMSPLSYEQQELELKVHQRLLEFGHQLEAALFRTGPGNYALFTTRAGLDKCEGWLEGPPILATLQQEFGVVSALGIGFGITAVDAQSNAEIALDRARHQRKACAFLVTGERRLIGPLAVERSGVDLRTDQAVSDLAQQTNLPPRVVGALMRMHQTGQRFTAAELAAAVKLTERSARRIINLLLNRGLATASGAEQPHVKGRPRQVFRVTPEAVDGAPAPDIFGTIKQKE